jgi:hypothetical protein
VSVFRTGNNEEHTFALMRRIVFETDPGRFTLIVVLILLASLSCMGNPGIATPYAGTSPFSVMEDGKKPLDEEGLSYSRLNEGASDVTGVKETSGGAGSEEENL